jgi:hypothetical protein
MSDETKVSLPVRKKVKGLKMGQRFRVLDSLRAKVERYQQETPTIAEAAKEISAELGFPVHGDQLRYIRSEAGIDWPVPRKTAGKIGHAKSKARLDRLEKLVVELYREFGKPIPEDFERPAVIRLPEVNGHANGKPAA